MEIQDGLESQVKFVIRSAAKPCGHAHAPFESIPGSDPCKSLTRISRGPTHGYNSDLFRRRVTFQNRRRRR